LSVVCQSRVTVISRKHGVSSKSRVTFISRKHVVSSKSRVTFISRKHGVSSKSRVADISRKHVVSSSHVSHTSAGNTWVPLQQPHGGSRHLNRTLFTCDRYSSLLPVPIRSDISRLENHSVWQTLIFRYSLLMRNRGYIEFET
jgi:hydroxyacyl-ACP dehydratase HTD2-like protein with hotdog domain